MADKVLGRICDITILEKLQCSLDEKRELLPLVKQILDYSRLVREQHILALAPIVPQITPSLLQKGIQLCTDGTVPEFIYKILLMSALCTGDEGQALLRNILILEGVIAIQQAISPDQVRDILLSLFGIDFQEEALAWLGENPPDDDAKKVAAYIAENSGKQASGACSLLDAPVSRMNVQGLYALLREISDDELAYATGKSAGKTKEKLLSAMTVRRGARYIDDLRVYGGERMSNEVVIKLQGKILGVIERLQQTGQIYFEERTTAY